jgi:hypothetical protein
MGDIEDEIGEAEHQPPPDLGNLSREEKYLELMVQPLKACARYKPKFGYSGKDGLSLAQFKTLYGSDPFYSWIGLDSNLMYAAHKAAGGMTSVYRQLGIGAQWVLNQVLQDQLSLSKEQANWSYTVPSGKGGTRKLSLDGRIDTSDLTRQEVKGRIEAWLDESAKILFLSPDVRSKLKGAVIEARQGYKSKDSKRQNADISNASNAYANLYMPVLVIFSTQIDEGVASRYIQAQWLLLKGSIEGSTTDSTYVFCRDVLGFDLAAFFQQHSKQLRSEVETILKTLLSPVDQ